MVQDDSDFEEEEARVDALIKQGTMGQLNYDQMIVTSDGLQQPQNQLDESEHETIKYEKSKQLKQAKLSFTEATLDQIDLDLQLKQQEV